MPFFEASGSIPVEVYSKKDTDEAIEEMKDKLRHYPMFIAMLESDKLEIAKDKIKIRHQKYKRCKKMAEYCNAKIEEYRAKYDADEGFGDEWLYWIKFMRKWRCKWLRLAEKFKEER